MGLVYLAIVLVFVFAPWLLSCLLAELLGLRAALLTAFRAFRSALRERVQRRGPWFWRTGSGA